MLYETDLKLYFAINSNMEKTCRSNTTSWVFVILSTKEINKNQFTLSVKKKK